LNKKISIAILGSTGSIGKQALDVISKNENLFQVEVLTAHSNSSLLIQQSIKYLPNAVVITNELEYEYVKNALAKYNISVYAGKDALNQVVTFSTIDIVLSSIVGFAGLESTISAIKAGKKIALANKESLVVAGNIIIELSKQYNSPIIPVDSEHSAIFQCLVGENTNNISKIYLTASGGPFRNLTAKELENVTLKDALLHPKWQMGNKITIDSATLMNKGLEAIEAKWLFNIKPEQIEIVVHPESIIHSMVKFTDGSTKAQLSNPDMRIPIQYAFSFPKRINSELNNFDIFANNSLNFEKPNLINFPSLNLAFYAMEKAGNLPCVLNAANEIAVNAFLNNKIKFTDIPKIVEKTLYNFNYIKEPSLSDLIETDNIAREISLKLIK
jgi:1-deoxy-D-xylulose-5-phosphate reductoisomerase